MRNLRHLTIVCVSVLSLALGACDDDEIQEPIVPGTVAIGGRCTLDSDCASGLCLANDQFPAGFCTQACNAGPAASCPLGTACFDLGGATGGRCLGPCADDLDCDDIGLDLTCTPFGGTQFCSNGLFGL